MTIDTNLCCLPCSVGTTQLDNVLVFGFHDQIKILTLSNGSNATTIKLLQGSNDGGKTIEEASIMGLICMYFVYRSYD